ncbi:MAG: hypothetical protein ORN28_03340, partial [Rhodoferax sp.]|nr:hypothetical protein [Rhodoferax sp.]
AGEVQAGLNQLNQIDASLTASFQPWWVARAHLLGLGGDVASEPRREALNTAIGLTSQKRIREHLLGLGG